MNLRVESAMKLKYIVRQFSARDLEAKCFSCCTWITRKNILFCITIHFKTLDFTYIKPVIHENQNKFGGKVRGGLRYLQKKVAIFIFSFLFLRIFFAGRLLAFWAKSRDLYIFIPFLEYFFAGRLLACWAARLGFILRCRAISRAARY